MTPSKLIQRCRTRWRIVLAVAAMITAIGWSVARPIYRRHRAIQEIAAVGGATATDRVRARWLRRWDFSVKRITAANCGDTSIDDEGLKRLSSLTSLRSLNLGNTAISDDGLKHLSNLRNLQDLDLSNTNIGDDGLQHLSGLTELEVLRLNGTGISDDGLKHLSGLKRLNHLWLNDTSISEKGLMHLSGLAPSLRWLFVRNSQVTDEGVRRLRLQFYSCEIDR